VLASIRPLFLRLFIVFLFVMVARGILFDIEVDTDYHFVLVSAPDSLTSI
tara:strand:- start:1106 stop:1255 length:150 start_codon:yes stop_codon:yes gene_type:complete